MEVRVSGADLANPVLEHQCSRVQVVDWVAGEPWVPLDELAQRFLVSFGLRQDAAGGTLREGLHPVPGRGEREWLSKHGAMRTDPQELVYDAPSQEPETFATTKAVDGRARGPMLRCIRIHGVEQNVGVNRDQRLLSVHRAVEGVAVREVDARVPHAVHGQWGK